MDSQIDLQQPVLDGGIRSINFFNGRLLSARDLTLEQSAYREADRRLGQAVGEGIAYGLEVSQAAKSQKQSPAVSVEAGLAVNRRGQTLLLDARADVALVRTTTALASSKVFTECEPLQTGAYVSGAGVYLLTIAPAQTTEGRATTNGMNPGAATCNSDTIVNAVQFRLIQLDPPITSAELQDKDHLRNRIAYKCFGVDETAAFITDPFGKEVKQWGLLDSLRPNQLTDCEVPLAVLYWTDDGINFIDMWSVRRRIVPSSADKVWPLLTSGRRASEGEAMFLQFQAQITELMASGANLSGTKAGDIFGYLPPVGILPVGSSTSFNYDVFFSEMTSRDPIFIEGAQLGPLIREAVHYPPVDTAAQIVVWLYVVRENAQAALASSKPPQSYIVFATGHTWYRGEAHYDIHHWNFGNFS
ncbi:MAG TPA: hypothetical protein VNG71_10435 [Pyrinomonadaceae bacterium]|nr:hypothetical protein [Pyrinomonadaceae bacterium]